MRWVLPIWLLLPATALLCQTLPLEPPMPSPLPQLPAPALPWVMLSAPLPNAPGAMPVFQQRVIVHPCPPTPPRPVDSNDVTAPPPNCVPPESPYQRFLNSTAPFPLTSRQKGFLAIHNVIDPANLATILLSSGFNVGLDAHNPYGPGWKGFGKNVGYDIVQDATGEFFSTFLFDSLLHEDPHYHRMPHAPIPRRFVHAISHTVISQHDDGTPMVNWSTLMTYPISAEIANLYVPGVHGNAPSTATRVGIGLATNPVDDLITEFLPDVARHVQVRIFFLQQIISNISTGQPF